MIGLFVALPRTGATIEPGLVRDSLSRLALGGKLVTELVCEEPFVLARVVSSSFGHGFAEEERVRTWLCGRVYPRRNRDAAAHPGPDADAADVTRAYLRQGRDGLTDLNGEFQLVLEDTRDGHLYLVNDRFALRPWYVLDESRGTFLSPGVRGLLPLLGSSPSLDPVTVAGFLAFNKMRLGDKTTFEGVEVLPAASLWEIDLDARKIRRDVYFQQRFSDRVEDEAPGEEFVAEIVNVYRRAMDVRSRGPEGARFGISLSGGLDSRSMLGALSPERAAEISSHTFGLPDSDEVRIAAIVAKTVGTDHHEHAMYAPDYVEHPGACARFIDELDLFVQGAQFRWMERARDSLDVVMTGIDLDVTLGGIYLTPETFECRGDADIVELLYRQNAVAPRDLLEKLLGPTLRPGLEAPYEMVADLVRQLPQEHAAAKYDLFIHRFSMRRVIMLRYGINRRFFETASPMYDYDLMELISQIPVNHRAGHRTFQRFLERLSPELAAITYQRTMVPATTPLEFWPRSIEIEQQRERLYLDVWRATAGRVHVPYRRFYTNYDEWLRMDRSWSDLTDSLLLARDARVYELGFLHPETVARLVEEHRRGARSWRQLLICMMSLELYLRELLP